MSSSWLIGSNPNVGAATVTVTANSVQEELTISAAQQGFYLYNGGSGSYDALFALKTALQTHTQITTATCVLRRDRLTSVTTDAGGSGWVVDSWGGAGGDAFQALLGYAGEEQVTPGATQVSTVQSPYLWSPGFNESSLEGRVGEDGVPYYDTQVGQSGNRVVVATTNNSGKRNTFLWPSVANARVWTSTEDTEEYYKFWGTVVRHFYQFKLWREVNEDTTSSTAATLSANLGPYVLRWNGDGALSFPYERTIDMLERYHPIRLPVVQVDEFS